MKNHDYIMSDNNVLVGAHREQDASETLWKPVYAVLLKSVGGVEAPCCCLSFAGAPHSGRPMLIGLQDGDIVSESYTRSDPAQVTNVTVLPLLSLSPGTDN